MPKSLKYLLVAISVFPLLPGHVMAGVRTEWKTKFRSENLLELYRITDYIDGILYVETKFYMGGKRPGVKPSITNWSIDCSRNRMRNSKGTIWVKDNGMWVEERRGYLAAASVPKLFSYYCSYLN